MKFSEFGKRFARHTGALSLMEDLGAALESGDSVFMLGGGNPTHAVLALKKDGGNRKFILCEQLDYIEDCTVERVKAVLRTEEEPGLPCRGETVDDILPHPVRSVCRKPTQIGVRILLLFSDVIAQTRKKKAPTLWSGPQGYPLIG